MNWMGMVRTVGVAVVWATLGAAMAAGQAEVSAAEKARVAEALKGFGRAHSARQVAVSPDGSRVAWISWGEKGAELRVANYSDALEGKPLELGKDGSCEPSDMTWSPNGRELAFLAECGGRQADLYVSDLDGKPARRLTKMNGYADSPAWSADGSRLAFLYVEGATRPAGALAAMKPWAGVVGHDGVEIQRVATVRADANEAKPEWATPAGLHVYEFDWRPDGQGLTFVAANPPGENNWWVAKIYSAEVGKEPQVVLDTQKIAGPLKGLQVAVPRWSPDGKQIAFIGGLMSDQGATGGDVWVVQADGSGLHNVTQGRPTTSSWIEWGSATELFATEQAGGNQQLIRYTLHGDGSATFGAPIFSIPGTVGDGRMELSLSATAKRDLFVFSASSMERAPEIYGARPGVVMSSGLDGVMRLTHWNDGLKAGWGQSHSLTWKSDNFRVQGWLVEPKNYDPAKKYPLIVLVHGGPSSATTSRWGAGGSLSPAVFSALGYFVLAPNPRGSFGEGEEFTQANRKDFGHGDLRDILAGVDQAVAKYSIDPERVGVTGWSYGGFMTMFSVTQTRRFKAAVAGAGIANWQSYYGENSIDQWMLPFFGASVYEDPAVYAQSSAINYIDKVVTPTLVVVGDRDGECPAPQSFEFWHALRAKGVATELVVYPNEGHGFVDGGHRRDVLERAVGWFDHYLQ